MGCASCHTTTHTTGDDPTAALSNQTIFPYTDLLLHDMGTDSPMAAPTFAADGQEWRTPPLWGIGLIAEVNGERFLLHDGRARTIEEAILWHGGEGQAAREPSARPASQPATTSYSSWSPYETTPHTPLIDRAPNRPVVQHCANSTPPSCQRELWSCRRSRLRWCRGVRRRQRAKPSRRRGRDDEHRGAAAYADLAASATTLSEQASTWCAGARADPPSCSPRSPWFATSGRLCDRSGSAR